MSVRNAVATRLRNLPIRRKLRLIFGLTTAIALTLSGVGMLIADSFLSFRYLRNDLGTFAEVIGNNSTGALAFDDPQAARETLGALRARSHVQVACLFLPDGKLLASFTRPAFSGSCPAPGAQAVRVAGLALIASEPVRLEGRRLGTLVLQYDLGEIFERVNLYGLIVLAGIFVSYILTIALSSRLRAIISGPILDLAGVARSVTRSGDYAIRAPKGSEDEVGFLSDAINNMIETVEFRDQELRRALEQQQAANAQMAALNAELERSNTDIERFAFMASHDLQEPLRMITAYSQLLIAKRESEDKAKLEEFARYIQGGTSRMRELLADLLAYSEITGSTDRKPEVVDLNLVVKDEIEVMRARLAEAGAEVSVDPLPVLNAHHNRIISLFQNLVENAVKYRSDAPLRIRIAVERGSGEFTFSVSDNGIGIAEEYYSKIFVAFQRLHGKEVPGTGIGLAICKRVVERYGGRIWVESKEGEGATFYFTLPLTMAIRTENANESQHT